MLSVEETFSSVRHGLSWRTSIILDSCKSGFEEPEPDVQLVLNRCGIPSRCVLLKRIVGVATVLVGQRVNHLLSQCIDGFLNVGIVHGLHIPNHRHHKALCKETAVKHWRALCSILSNHHRNQLDRVALDTCIASLHLLWRIDFLSGYTVLRGRGGWGGGGGINRNLSRGGGVGLADSTNSWPWQRCAFCYQV